MRGRRVVAGLALMAASLGASGCSGQDTATVCPPVAGTVTSALTDDRGVLSAKVWLPVVSGKGPYVTWLAPLNVASRSLTTSELEAILAAPEGPERDAAVLGAVADIPETGKPARGADLRTYRLLVPSSPAGAAVADFYATALERQGNAVDTTIAATSDALAGVARGTAGDVALLELPDLAGSLGALLPSTGPSGQVKAAATVASERGLVLGSPTAANRTPQVLVTQAFAAAHGGLTDLSGLAQACPRLAVAATDTTVDSLAPLAAAYGLRTDAAARDAVERVRSGLAVAALAPAVHHAG